MNIIKAVNLVFDYIRRDEEGQVEDCLLYTYDAADEL